MSTSLVAEPVVTLRDVTKSYSRGAETIVAVNRASIDVRPGTFTVVSGPSGSGKTTLLNLTLGWELPDTGARLPATPPTDWSEIAVVPQRLGLIEQLTVAENVAMPGRRTGLLALDPDEVMRHLRIHHLADRFPAETSLGEQQRTACARALVARPRLLVADEPTSHQDDDHTHRICLWLLDAARHGSAVIVATHDRRVAAHASTRYDLVDGVLRQHPT